MRLTLVAMVLAGCAALAIGPAPQELPAHPPVPVGADSGGRAGHPAELVVRLPWPSCRSLPVVFLGPGVPQGLRKALLTDITFPKTTDNKVKKTFHSCGSAEDSVIGLLLDTTDENWLWPGTTIQDAPVEWKVKFEDVDKDYGTKTLFVRVELVLTGSHVGNDVDIELAENGKDDCPQCCAVQDAKAAKASAKRGEKLSIKLVQPGTTISPGDTLKVHGKVGTQKTEVYGLLIPTFATGGKVKPIKGVKKNAAGGMHFQLHFATPNDLPEGVYIVRVRRGGKADKDAFDDQLIRVRK